MSFKNFRNGLCAAAVGLIAGSAQAETSIKFGLCYDLTKVYSFALPQMYQAVSDLAAVTNASGGIQGHEVELLLLEHGNEPQRGIECYEHHKAEGAILIDTVSSPVSRAILPRVLEDGIVMTQSMVGRSDAVDGKVFPWVFPIGATYWGMSAAAVNHAKTLAGGDLSGRKIAFLYVDYPFGQEPIPMMETLAAEEGFELELYPYPLPGNDQSSAFSRIRRSNPDYLVHWGAAGMQVVMAREALRNGIPMDKIITTPWINGVDIGNIGAKDAAGIMRVSTFAVGADVPLVDRIKTELYDAGNGSGDEKWLGDNYYNFALAYFSAVFKAADIALEGHDGPLSAEMLREGLEQVTSFDGEGIMPPITITAEDHSGGGLTRIDQWDGDKWVPMSEWSAPYSELVWETVHASSAQFAADGN